MVYAYLRVSSDKQDADNQKSGIQEYCAARNLQPDEFIEDVVSGTKDWQTRQLGKLIEKALPGDVVVFAEVSRIARSTLQCLQVLQVCADKKLIVHVAKQQMIFDNSLNSKIIATTLSLASEIEREFISLRTKEALQKRKQEGIVLGRPKGSKSDNAKLLSNHTQLVDLLKKKVNISNIARIFEVDRKTVTRYVKEKGLVT